MQLTIERSALLKALGHVQSVVERRNTSPSSPRPAAPAATSCFAATDLDMEMVDEAEAVNVEGQITAPRPHPL
jgi:DNA polymerase-3 subunit beta